jgi:hypothetical protein
MDMPPAVGGEALVGQTLTVGNGSWRGATPITYTYQWTRSGTAIATATASTYVLAALDLNDDIGCNVTATNSAGATTSPSKNTVHPAA